MKNIYITDYIDHPDVESEILGNHLSPNLHEDVEVLLVWHEPITPEYIDALPNLKGIIRYGVGYENIDLSYAAKKNIVVCNTPDYGTEEVADTTLAMMLTLARGTARYDSFSRSFENGSWQENKLYGLKRLSSLKLGILGCGRIGTCAAFRAKAFGFDIAFFDPFQPSGYEKAIGISRVSTLEELLSRSDIISIHTPLNHQTNGIVDEFFIDKMKERSILINTSRGKVLKNLDLLYEPLKSGKLLAAGLDVLPEEPPREGMLLSAWKNREPWLEGRLIINPHTAYYTDDAFLEMRKKASLNAMRVINGEVPLNILNSLSSPALPVPSHVLIPVNTDSVKKPRGV